MSKFHVRKNGQAEMRDIIRTAIREAGYSQARAAEAAGIKYSRLVSCLGGNQWFREEDVAALAKVLDVDMVDLVGGSIFEGDARSAEFDHQHPDGQPRQPVESTYTPFDRRALCCECGSLRTMPAKAVTEWSAQPGERPRRATLYAFCVHCNESMLHAYLLPSAAAWRNEHEVKDHRPSAYREAMVERDRLIDRLREFNVAVYYRARSDKSRAREFVSLYVYDDSKSEWRIELDPNLPPRAQTTVITDLWTRISTGDHGDIDWDVRKVGSMSQGAEWLWEGSVQDLMTDIDRYLDVERERMVHEIYDEVAHLAPAPSETTDADQ